MKDWMIHSPALLYQQHQLSMLSMACSSKQTSHQLRHGRGIDSIACRRPSQICQHGHNRNALPNHWQRSSHSLDANWPRRRRSFQPKSFWRLCTQLEAMPVVLGLNHIGGPQCRVVRDGGSIFSCNSCLVSGRNGDGQMIQAQIRAAI